MPRRLACLLLPLVLAACATAPEPAPAPPAREMAEIPAHGEAPAEDAAVRLAAQNLDQGIRAYENGQYKAARQSLKSALEGPLAAADQVTANKLLAFMACADGQRASCKAHFRKALAANPTFTLSRTEAGHPVWGKAFREVKAEKPRKD